MFSTVLHKRDASSSSSSVPTQCLYAPRGVCIPRPRVQIHLKSRRLRRRCLSSVVVVPRKSSVVMRFRTLRMSSSRTTHQNRVRIETTTGGKIWNRLCVRCLGTTPKSSRLLSRTRERMYMRSSRKERRFWTRCSTNWTVTVRVPTLIKVSSY